MVNKILDKYIDNEKFLKFSDYSLSNIMALLELLDNPHKKFKSIHIAGTNGKGSTAYMIAAILGNEGFRTGLYTSPHLEHVNERIKINLQDITDSKLYHYIKKIDSLLESNKNIHPTYFDLLTASAYCYFRDEAVEIAVIETGLGGRLDSTNTIIPELSIITDISFDHMHILGKNIADITDEKCGIIKKNTPVITSNTEPEVCEIIKNHSKDKHSDAFFYGNDFFGEHISHTGNRFIFNFWSTDISLNKISLPLFPEHQIKNASIVIMALITLREKKGMHITDENIRKSLADISIPARFQILAGSPLVIYDPAHNYMALNNLINGLDKYYNYKEKVYILSLMKDKAEENTLEIFKELNTVYFILNDPRGYIPCSNQFKIITSDTKIIIDMILKADKNKSMFIFTGTFRMFSKANEIINKLSNYKESYGNT